MAVLGETVETANKLRRENGIGAKILLPRMAQHHFIKFLKLKIIGPQLICFPPQSGFSTPHK